MHTSMQRPTRRDGCRREEYDDLVSRGRGCDRGVVAGVRVTHEEPNDAQRVRSRCSRRSSSPPPPPHHHPWETTIRSTQGVIAFAAVESEEEAPRKNYYTAFLDLSNHHHHHPYRPCPTNQHQQTSMSMRIHNTMQPPISSSQHVRSPQKHPQKWPTLSSLPYHHHHHSSSHDVLDDAEERDRIYRAMAREAAALGHVTRLKELVYETIGTGTEACARGTAAAKNHPLHKSSSPPAPAPPTAPVPAPHSMLLLQPQPQQRQHTLASAAAVHASHLRAATITAATKITIRKQDRAVPDTTDKTHPSTSTIITTTTSTLSTNTKIDNTNTTAPVMMGTVIPRHVIEDAARVGKLMRLPETIVCTYGYEGRRGMSRHEQQQEEEEGAEKGDHSNDTNDEENDNDHDPEEGDEEQKGHDHDRENDDCEKDDTIIHPHLLAATKRTETSVPLVREQHLNTNMKHAMITLLTKQPPPSEDEEEEEEEQQHHLQQSAPQDPSSRPVASVRNPSKSQSKKPWRPIIVQSFQEPLDDESSTFTPMLHRVQPSLSTAAQPTIAVHHEVIDEDDDSDNENYDGVDEDNDNKNDDDEGISNHNNNQENDSMSEYTEVTMATMATTKQQKVHFYPVIEIAPIQRSTSDITFDHGLIMMQPPQPQQQELQPQLQQPQQQQQPKQLQRGRPSTDKSTQKISSMIAVTLHRDLHRSSRKIQTNKIVSNGTATLGHSRAEASTAPAIVVPSTIFPSPSDKKYSNRNADHYTHATKSTKRLHNALNPSPMTESMSRSDSDQTVDAQTATHAGATTERTTTNTRSIRNTKGKRQSSTTPPLDFIRVAKVSQIYGKINKAASGGYEDDDVSVLTLPGYFKDSTQKAILDQMSHNKKQGIPTQRRPPPSQTVVKVIESPPVLNLDGVQQPTVSRANRFFQSTFRSNRNKRMESTEVRGVEV